METRSVTPAGPPGTQSATGLAALKNVARFMTLVETLKSRGPYLPGLGVFNGPSGFGKTYAAIYAMNITRAPRLEVGDSWTKKKFLENLLREVGVEPGRASIADLTEMAIEALADDFDRPLIIDEADKLVDKGMIELVREIYEHAQIPVVLIGEELLPQKLAKYERVHNRVLCWVQAEPCDLEDAAALAELFCPELSLSEDLLQLVIDKSGGRARRIAINLDQIARDVALSGNGPLLASSFNEDFFFTGEPPKRVRRAS
ncbi:AAA family ATPase [Roseibium sp.]|uniref:AAA family ATPase n=1 Tax=Roseibium sp. TaxID=1936156 RepID=UPI003A96C67A